MAGRPGAETARASDAPPRPDAPASAQGGAKPDPTREERRSARAARWSRAAAHGHRLSGVALAAFLPLHFLMLGLALEGEAALDRGLALAAHPMVVAAEWGLVVLLALHLGFGLRVLAIELLPWPERDPLRAGWIVTAVAFAGLVGLGFLAVEW